MAQRPEGKDEIELGTHEYWRRDPRTGKMVKDFSPRWARNWFFVCVAALVWVFWVRDQFSPEMLFGGTVLWAFGGGVMFANWLKNIY
jgi:hypothetical protein